MKTAWDYSALARAYLKRPDYAASVIDTILRVAGLGNGARACDVGAGVAHLTLMLLERGLDVVAVEPNDEMRALGVERTSGTGSIRWFEGTGESTGQRSAAFDLVTFGSSFNVTDRPTALHETARILRPGGWFACMWNHRDLDDPLQAAIEETIRRRNPAYGYGTRREDQTEVIDASGLFGTVERVEGRVVHRQTVADCVEAWRSHATLQRQAGATFPSVISDIEQLLRSRSGESVEVPYTTRAWVARVRA